MFHGREGDDVLKWVHDAKSWHAAQSAVFRKHTPAEHYNMLVMQAFPYGSPALGWYETRGERDVLTAAKAHGTDHEGHLLTELLAAVKKEYQHLAGNATRQLMELQLTRADEPADFFAKFENMFKRTTVGEDTGCELLLRATSAHRALLQHLTESLVSKPGCTVRELCEKGVTYSRVLRQVQHSNPLTPPPNKHTGGRRDRPQRALVTRAHPRA